MPPTDTASLQALARRHGILYGYYDIRGVERVAPEATLRTLLAAMGVDPDQMGAGGANDAGLTPGVLPPAIVVRQRDQPARLALSLRESTARDTLHCRIVEESGRVRRQAFCPADGAATGGGVIDGTEYRRYELALDVALPIGYHRVQVQARSGVLARTQLIIVPDACYRPEIATGDGRAWGAAAQLYALRSERNWGIGDFTDLRLLVEQWGARGADIVGVNPLHALFLAAPERASPYSASSRLFLNPLYLDVESVPEYAECDAAREHVRAPSFQTRLQALRNAEWVDYAGVAGAKLEILEQLFAHFGERHMKRGTARGLAFRAFVRTQGLPLRRYALFEALHAHFVARSPGIGDWRQWPAAYRDPDSRETRRFAREHRARVEFFSYLQWQCELQLDAVHAIATAVGLHVGLYRDLAVSVEASGADAWARQSLYAAAAAIGAPPDDYNQQGQNWGLAPLLPGGLVAAGYQPWIDVLRRNMRRTGALRIDHVMALWRLFWIPDGVGPAQGTYVEYPHAAMLGILALESTRNRCVVIGEDLGTVPNEVRAAMHELGILSYRLLIFERDHGGEFRAPSGYPPEALAAFASHDLPTLAGFWEGRDLVLRAELGIYPDAGTRDAAVAARAEDRARLLGALEREGLLPDGMTARPVTPPAMTPELARAIHVFLARSPARFVLVQLEDVLGQWEQVNVPGTDVDRYRNWRRRLALPLEQWPQTAAFAALTGAIAAERRSALRSRNSTPIPDASADRPGAT